MSQYKKILVINLMHVGDLLLVTPVLRALRSAFPQSRIDLIADAKLSDLVRLNKNIDHLWAIDKKGYHDRLWNYLKFIGEIRAEGYDLVINLHRNERASFIAALSGAGRIIGYATWGPHILFDQVMPNLKAVKHQVHSHFDVLRQGLGLTELDDRGIEMWLDPAVEEKALERWHQAFPDANLTVVGFNTGASWPTKRWHKEHYAAMADQLIQRGYGIAFFGGPMDVELVDETLDRMAEKDNPRLAVFTGRVSLMELAAMLKKCRVLATNDSGPMHVAVAVGTPVVAPYGSSPVPGFYPYDERSIVIQSPVECHPCGEHTCDHHTCMKIITPELFLEKVLAVIEGKPYERGHGRPRIWQPDA